MIEIIVKYYDKETKEELKEIPVGFTNRTICHEHISIPDNISLYGSTEEEMMQCSKLNVFKLRYLGRCSEFKPVMPLVLNKYILTYAFSKAKYIKSKEYTQVEYSLQSIDEWVTVSDKDDMSLIRSKKQIH